MLENILIYLLTLVIKAAIIFVFFAVVINCLYDALLKRVLVD